MTLPTAETVAARAQVTSNDPRVAPALAVALAWARDRLGRPADDTLADLNATGNEAVAAMAVDVLKVPALQLALGNPENADIGLTIPFDIGRRWETMLCRGNRHLWALR